MNNISTSGGLSFTDTHDSNRNSQDSNDSLNVSTKKNISYYYLVAIDSVFLIIDSDIYYYWRYIKSN